VGLDAHIDIDNGYEYADVEVFRDPIGRCQGENPHTDINVKIDAYRIQLERRAFIVWGDHVGLVPGIHVQVIQTLPVEPVVFEEGKCRIEIELAAPQGRGSFGEQRAQSLGSTDKSVEERIKLEGKATYRRAERKRADGGGNLLIQPINAGGAVDGKVRRMRWE